MPLEETMNLEFAATIYRALKALGHLLESAS